MMALEPAPSDASRPINGGIECLEQDVEDAQSTDEELDAGDASDEDSDMGSEDYADDLKTRLQQSLDDSQHQGTFASFRTQSAYINPGLYVNEIGSIGLPLSVRDARAIAGVCKKSPFGKGDATLVDETVRKTWELETSEIACRNPAWAQYLDGLARQAIQDLGVQVPAWAQPYKLLLYEEGAFFKIHRDTEKVPGMFGTLVVCLPSEHAGGEVLLAHGKKKRTIKTATSSAFELSALAWYSDVQHEIRPVTSGYRMVLTYNLVQDKQQPKQTATGLDAHLEQLERSLRRWNSHLPPFDYLVYPLEHLYTPSGLSLLHLKGQDAAKGRSLEQLCSKNNFYWFLARMTKSEQEDFYDDDDLEEDMVVDRIVTPAGKSIILNTRWPPPEQILADVETLYARDPDSEDEGEFTGNENMPSTCRYHNTVAILMRKADVLESFSTQSNHSSTSLLALFDLVRNDSCCSARHRRKAMSIVLQRSLQKHMYHQTEGAYWLHNSYMTATPKDGEVFTQVSEYCCSADMGDLVTSMLRTAMVGRAWWNSKEFRAFVGIQLRKEILEGKDNVWDSW
jgi:predicted 2-oxoglutarate/Fe(II)-dependent dioxygenase YbiX